MIDYTRRTFKKEILDQPGIPFEDIADNLAELNLINRWLGGHSITLSGFRRLLNKKKKISVCEIGCGGGDNLNVIYDFCKDRNILARFEGIDINPECVSFAKKTTSAEDMNFITADYKEIIFREQKPDIIFSSLFCHHFNDQELVEMVQWMNENSGIGFFINDLHRHPLAYNFIKLATKLFSKSYLVKNDAPISVLRGFKKNEWKAIFKKAGIHNYSVEWRWAFRYLIVSPLSPGRERRT